VECYFLTSFSNSKKNNINLSLLIVNSHTDNFICHPLISLLENKLCLCLPVSVLMLSNVSIHQDFPDLGTEYLQQHSREVKKWSVNLEKELGTSENLLSL